MKTKQSAYETIMRELLTEAERIIDDSYLTTKEARKLLDIGYKLLYKVEELRVGKDKWQNKYKNKISYQVKELTKSRDKWRDKYNKLKKGGKNEIINK